MPTSIHDTRKSELGHGASRGVQSQNQTQQMKLQYCSSITQRKLQHILKGHRVTPKEIHTEITIAVDESESFFAIEKHMVHM